MTKEEILNKTKGILAVVRPAISQDSIDYKTVLVRDMGLDSLSMLLMGLALEKEFNVRFPNNIQFVTVDDVCESILKLLSE